MKKNRVKNAFTLIESILAISIIAIAFVAILNLFPFALKIENSSEMKTRAIGLAQAKLEEFYQKSYEEIKCAANNPPCQLEESIVPEDQAFKRVTSIIFVNPQNNYSESASDTGIKKVKVILYWKNPFSQTEDNFSITTLFSKR